MTMSRGTRDVFILAGCIAVYGIVLWLYEAKLADAFGETFANDPKAIFARDHDRDRRIAEELGIPTFTPPADTMTAAPLEENPDA
jgi:hypothetical protein